MKMIIITAVAGTVLAGTAHADGLKIVECVGNGAQAECEANLVNGQDYLFRFGAGDVDDGKAQLINPIGAATIDVTFEGGAESDAGREFRAAYSASYRVRVIPNSEEDVMTAGIYTDCRASNKTRCLLASGKTAQGRLSANGDLDWYKANLRKGKTYTFTLATTNYCEIILRDRSGKSVARTHSDASISTIKYKAKLTGPYYLEVLKGTVYTVGLK